MRKLLTIIACFTLAAAPALAAYGQKGDWEFGPYAGWAWLDDYGDTDPDDGFLIGGRVGYWLSDSWSLEASYQQLLESEISVFNEDLEVDSLRLNLLWNLRPGERLRWHLTAGVGQEMTQVGSALDESDFGYNLGGGLRAFFTDHFGLRIDARWVSTDVGGALDERQNNLEGTVGLTWALGGGPPPDTDGDGVTDKKDDCPNTPRGAAVDEKGCPKDSDGDGAFDGLDACPDTPAKYPVDGRGCPTDKDGDGVMDGADSCPDTPKGAIVDAKGCTKDTDGDGVVDGIDTCANTPKGATVDAKGCPKDTDGDGVPDGMDKCPGTQRPAKVDANGCVIPEPPKAEPEIFKGKATLVLEGVTFETSSAKLTAAARDVLKGVAASLKDYPELKIEVAGHTDSTGSAVFNRTLSQDRADSVRTFLIENGVNGSNLTAKGYGPDVPVADNGTKEGRALNRRVELTQVGK